MRASIHRFKYRGEYARGRFLGRLLADHAESTLARRKELAEIVVPVPLHVRRWRARGYNQAEILATPVAERLGLPLSHGLIRTGKTRPQADLRQAERWENVKNARHGGWRRQSARPGPGAGGVAPDILHPHSELPVPKGTDVAK